MPALISHSHPDAVFAYDNAEAISAAQYLAAVQHLASYLAENLVSKLSGSGHVLNLCTNRYRFAVVMGAALLLRQPMLLPSTRTPAMLARLQQQYEGLYAVTDDNATQSDIFSCIDFATALHGAPQTTPRFEVLEIDATQTAAYIFTSGSTGAPIGHSKSWGMLVRNAYAEGERVREFLSLANPVNAANTPFTVTGTVPAQHMYGIESTILLPMHNGAAMDASHPFFPADIENSLHRVPAPRVLVSTPFHLRTMIEAGSALPELSLLISATAPLSPQLAKQAEHQLGAPLLEIYGCTEAGQLATRRTTQSRQWVTYSDIQIQTQTDELSEVTFIAHGGHIEGRIPLGDVLELESACTFNLIGRKADMINVAGKRTSLAYLNHELNSIDGVTDGVFFWPDGADKDSSAKVQRLLAFVVAPSLTQAHLLAALRQRIDSVFVPRSIFFLEHLPRNETGKLPQQTLERLAATLKAVP